MKPLRGRWWRDPGPAVWGEEDEFYYGVHPDRTRGPSIPAYTPINETLTPPPPERSIEGFTLFPKPERKRKPDRSRRAAADAALHKLGLRR